MKEDEVLIKEPEQIPTRWLRPSLAAAFGLFAYFLCGHLGLQLATIQDNVSPIWPASGFAAAYLAVLGTAFWPVVLMGAFLLNWSIETALAPSLFIAMGNCAEAFVVAYWLRRSGHREGLNAKKAFFSLSLVGIPASVLAALSGTSSLYFAGLIPRDQTAAVFQTWFAGDYLGLLIVAPVVLAFFYQKQLKKTEASIREQALFVFVVMVLFSLVPLIEKSPLVFVFFPLLIWLHLKFNYRWSVVYVLAVSSLFIFCRLLGLGIFQSDILNQDLIHLTIFLASLSISSMALKAFAVRGLSKNAVFTILSLWTGTAFLFFAFSEYESKTAQNKFLASVEKAENVLEDRLSQYENVLRGGLSLFAASKHVNRKEWREYVENFKLQDRFPGINGMGVIFPVDEAELPRFVELNKQDSQPDFFVHAVDPSNDLSKKMGQHMVIQFIEPLDRNRAALGLDIGSELNRRRSAETSRDYNIPSMTARITLVQHKTEGAGFLFYVPFYRSGALLDSVAARRENFLGWIYAPVIVNHFVKEVLSRAPDGLALNVFDGDQEDKPRQIFYSKFNGASSKLVRVVDLANHQWTMAWSALPGFFKHSQNLSAWIAALGSLLSLVVGLLLARVESAGQSALALSNSMAQIVWEADLSGKIYYTNDRWKGYFKNHPDQDFNKILMGSIHPDERMAFERLWKNSLWRREDFESELRLLNNQGEYQWQLCRMVGSVDRGAHVGRYYGTATNIENVKNLESERRQLITAREAAKEASRLKSEFLATMSHEVRTPINGVLGATELISRTDLNDEQKHYVEVMGNSGKTLLRLVNDILDLSKIESGRLDIETNGFNLHRMLRLIVEGLQILNKRSEVQVSLEIGQRVPEWVRGDSMRLKQVLENLLANAIKFTHTGTVKLIVNHVASLEMEDRVLFLVEDTGIGMNAETLQKLFRPFTQADTSMTRRYGGTGLGLSITKHLVEAMRGQISVESKMEEGSKFLVELPLREHKRLDPSLKHSHDSSLQGLTLLLAEDNATNRLIAQTMLKKLGAQVVAVENGVEVLEALGSSSFDLILMDCQMPEMDGYECSRSIRSSTETWSKIPIVAFTANAFKKDEEKCLESGMNGFLSKPVDMSRLAEVILYHVGGKDRKNQAA